MAEDFYTILGVSKDADTATIKKAYRAIARENHPDLNPDNKEAEERFKVASVAFEVLNDTDRRKLYDEFGLDGLREGFDAEQARAYGRWQGQGGQQAGQRTYARGGGYDDLFESIFGGRSPFDTSDYSNFGGFYTGPTRGQDLEARLSLDFMTAVRGGELEITVGGRAIKVRVPAGIEHEERLRLKGKGQAVPTQAPKGSKAGDLLLTIEVKLHPLLKRDGLNLSLEIPITMLEAIEGAKIPIPTPHGEYKVSVPAGVNSGARLRLKGQGVHRGSKKGDFFAVVQIHTPDRLDEDVVEHARKIEEAYSTDVRADIKL